MANPTMTLIASNTVGSGGVSSVTFSSIPATYTDLVVKSSPRFDEAYSSDTMKVSFNGSTSTFTYRILVGNGSSAASYNNTFGNAGDINAATSTSNTFSNMEMYIPNYTSSNNKSFSVDSVSENNGTAAIADLIAGLWSTTSAITSITFTPYSGGNFVQYSTFYLYGISSS